MGRRKRRFKIQPLLNISAKWLFGSPLPDTLNVAMDNGTYARYGLDAHAERICTGKHGWEETGEQVIGYQMKRAVNRDQLMTASVTRKATAMTT